MPTTDPLFLSYRLDTITTMLLLVKFGLRNVHCFDLTITCDTSELSDSSDYSL